MRHILTYGNIDWHYWLKLKKVWSIMASTKIKPIPPMVAQIAAGSQTAIGASSVRK
jgi:hypothetical protein